MAIAPGCDARARNENDALPWNHHQTLPKCCLSAPRGKRYSLKWIASKKTCFRVYFTNCRPLCCRYEENASAADTNKPGWAGNPMSAKAEQRINAIAARASVVTPPRIELSKNRLVARWRHLHCIIWYEPSGLCGSVCDRDRFSSSSRGFVKLIIDIISITKLAT